MILLLFSLGVTLPARGLGVKVPPEPQEVARSPRTLGIDQGSEHLGAALIEDRRVVWTRRVTTPREWPWRRQMTFVCRTLHADLFGGSIPNVDIIGIEDVVVGLNVTTALKMAKTVGWLTAELASWYPDAPIYHVHPATVAAGVEAPRKRLPRIQRYNTIAEQLIGRRVSEDEAAAVCVALATLTMWGER